MSNLNFTGLLLGIVMLILTGFGHLFIIKGQYYWDTRLWPLLLILGILFTAASLFAGSALLSGILGISGVTLFWSIYELFKQKERVRKGWFPDNPNRAK